MPKTSSLEEILGEARKQEKAYGWLAATESYGKALGAVSEQDFFKKGEVLELLGHAFYRLARQADSLEEFMDRMRQAISHYGEARKSYGTMNAPGKTPRTLRCSAMIAYLEHWLKAEATEKKKLIDECWRLTKEVLKAFEETEDVCEYGRTLNQLSTSPLFGLSLEWNFEARRKIISAAIECGEKAIRLTAACGDSHALARAHVDLAAYLEMLSYYFLEPNEKEKALQKAGNCWQKANELSEETSLLELLSILGAASLDWGEGTDKALKTFEKALEYGSETKDRLIIGCALDWLNYHTFWKAYVPEDQDERLGFIKKALQYAEEAKNNYSLICFIGQTKGPLWANAPHAEYYRESAIIETNLNERRELLEKAAEASPEMLEEAEESGCPENLLHAHHTFSKALTSLAAIETNPDEKKKLLERALEHRNDTIRITEQLIPFDYWDRGVMLIGLADTKCELANLVEDSEDRKTRLQEAIMDEEDALKLCVKGFALGAGPSASMWANLGSEQCKLGDWIDSLYQLTNNKDHLRKAAQAFADAAESYQKTEIRSRTAECFWKSARVYDDRGDFLKSAQNFELASDNYGKAAEKIPQFKDFYLEHAGYMLAWGEIEKARHYHARQEYGLALEHFEKAASLHKSLKRWSYLATNYAAWAQVENAEILSRKEQSEEALEAFERAARLFRETQQFLQTQLAKIEDPDEKEMAANMIKATDLRQQYCTARIALEEARILDKKGDHYSSSEKYGSAVEKFEEISKNLPEQERKEVKFITDLSRAWQKMTLAEVEASPSLYGEASQLFEQAKDLGSNEEIKLLALGHSRFCKALEAGTQFADTRDPTLHTIATKHLESATNYYLKANFQKASEYVKATKALFDAYLYMDNATKESDPEKKAKLYVIAEKVLQTSAGCFMKAEQPSKREQVLRMLEKVKEERELAVSITEVLHASSIVSTTASFTTPNPTSEEAVGTERFEHADIRANIVARKKELRIGESLDVEIELVNAGKNPALLTKITEITPEGFELAEKPEGYRLEDNYLNMKGRRLDPLKTEEVKLTIKPKAQGEFSLKPTILYLDENGRYKSHVPEPITITVKELGIKGWLKGER